MFAMALICKDGFQLHFTYDLGFGWSFDRISPWIMQEAAGTLQVHRETCSGSTQTTRCHLTHEPNQNPLWKAQSYTGRESKQRTPSAVGCQGGDGQAACNEVLQCSTRWCCILEISLPCGSFYIGWGLRCGKHTQILLLRHTAFSQGKYGFLFAIL